MIQTVNGSIPLQGPSPASQQMDDLFDVLLESGGEDTGCAAVMLMPYNDVLNLILFCPPSRDLPLHCTGSSQLG